jgi:hypothetical protein
MSFNKKTLRDFLLFWGLLFAFFLVVYQFQTTNPVLRPRLERIEAFQVAKAVPLIANPYILGDDILEPDDSTLEKPREPYNLLKDLLPEAVVRVSPTSQRCYETDFQTRIEKTGNFKQLTNNYKRGEPDSCSSPLHEFVLSYYKPEVLA